MRARRFPSCLSPPRSAVSSPQVCKIMAFWAILRDYFTYCWGPGSSKQDDPGKCHTCLGAMQGLCKLFVECLCTLGGWGLIKVVGGFVCTRGLLRFMKALVGVM